jgi:predicted protein tyrosine phosphatase
MGTVSGQEWSSTNYMNWCLRGSGNEEIRGFNQGLDSASIASTPVYLFSLFMVMKVLFICNQNQDRSTTAEELFQDRFETKSAGLYNTTPVTVDELAWADSVLVMEDHQRAEIAKRFPKLYLEKRILCLDVEDRYHYQQPELVKELQSKVMHVLKPMSKVL